MPSVRVKSKPSAVSNDKELPPVEGMPPLENGRLSLLPVYLASQINAQNAALRAKGVDLIDLGMGNPSDPVASNVIAAMKEALDVLANHRYAPATGILELKEAFARHYERHFNVTLSPEREVVVGLGSKDTFSHLFLAILGPQDACVMPTPAYTPHLFGPQIAGAHVAGVFMDEENPGRALVEGIKHIFEVIRPHPKLLLLNFPHNPTAKTVELSFFEEIIQLARFYKFWVLNDLAYGHNCFDGYQAPSLLQARGARDVAVETFTMSKPYSMAGWRVGFMAGNSRLIDAVIRIKPFFDYGHFYCIQHAAAVALDTGDEYIRHQSQLYRQRRDVLLEGLAKNGWGRTIKNRATMFSWQPLPAQARQLGSMAWCAQLVEQTGVSFFPGGGFGAEGEGFVRIALVEPEARIVEACRRIGKFLGGGQKA